MTEFGMSKMLATAATAAAAFGLVQAAAPAWARKAGPCHAVTEQVSAMKVTLNKSRTLCFSDPFSTAVIGAPEIADVLPMTDSMLYVQGKKSARPTFLSSTSNGIWCR